MPSAPVAMASEPAARSPAKRGKASASHAGKRSKNGAADGLSAQLAATAAACKVPKFLRSLYAILQTEDPRVIAWVQNQELKPNRVTAFHILEMARFEREILPKYFKHQKFASFQRQLNNFGFRKWTKTQSSGVCTFSHNCFPPDPTLSGVTHASIRDQWRQKSSQVVPPATSSASSSSPPGPQPSRRRIVGNGIVKSRARHQQPQSQQASSASRRRPANVQVLGRGLSDQPFTETYRSPNSNGSMESSGYRHNPSHQPPLKKLARPAIAMQESLNGLEAFCEDSFKQFILPPLQPHHLLAATPRGSTPTTSLPITSSFSSHSDVDASPSFGGFRHSLAQAMNYSASSSSEGGYGYKTYEYKHADTQPHAYPPVGAHGAGNGALGADAAALQGTFLEPWMWDAQASSSGFELGSFPLEFEWQEGSNSYPNNGYSTAASMASTTSSAMANKESQCHQQDRGVPSNAEEFGLENLLFVE